MSTELLQRALADLPRYATLIKDRGYRQIWRLEFSDKPYFLKYYPRANRLKRLLRGTPGGREFSRLKWLQKAQIPAPRAIALLVGYVLNGVKGDAVILEGLEPSVTLEEYFQKNDPHDPSSPTRRELMEQLLHLLAKLHASGLGHSDLHLGNLLLHQGKIYLLDGYAVHRGGVSKRDLMLLGHSVQTLATKTEILRGWRTVRPNEPIPIRNSISQSMWRKFLSRTTQDNRYFGRVNADGWRGHFFRQYKLPRAWSSASHLNVSDADWNIAWPKLLEQVERNELPAIKDSRSGSVLKGETTLAGKTVRVIVKRPRRKFWWRYLVEIIRPTRAIRAWRTAWSLVARDIPTAWPLLVMQKYKLGYVTDMLIVFEQLEGKTLAETNLDELSPMDRESLFRNCGRMLRRLEQTGLYHWDAKSSNFIVRDGKPMLIDVDGIRRHEMNRSGVRRLLTSLHDHQQFTPEDSLAICLGYAPHALIVQQERT